MLSNTKGYSRYSHTLGYRLDDLSALRQVCPTWKSTGKCRAYNREREIRHTLASAKEADLVKKATALYEAQMDLVANLGDVEGDAAPLASTTSLAGFSPDPTKKAEIVQRLLTELKQEPAYLNWSLDAAVAERMVELKIKPCRYTHRGELTALLKRSRSAREKEEVRLKQQQSREQQDTLKSSNVLDEAYDKDQNQNEGGDAVQTTLMPTAVTAGSQLTRSPTLTGSVGSALSAVATRETVITAQQLQWEEERYRIFRSLTPLQRCIVCLLWQRRYAIEQGVICDVRLMLEKRLTEMFDRTGRAVVDGVVVAEQRTDETTRPNTRKKTTEECSDVDNDDDPLEMYLSSVAFEELVERESKRIVTRVAFRPEFGLVDLSALPLLIAHLSTTPACGVFLARTLTYFTGESVPPVKTTACNKNKNKDTHSEVEDLRPAPTSFHHLLFPSRKPVTEKEIDLGGTARADEVVEAIEWGLQIYERERELHTKEYHTGKSNNASLCAPSWSSTPATDTASNTANPADSFAAAVNRVPSLHISALFRRQRIRLHGLTLTHCKMTSADALVSALHKRHLEEYLYAFDLSDNRLWSLRFLLMLRAHFAERLLRLSLRSNPITRKPEYQEQVRLSLPQLTSLDGEPIRRPPLRLPKPSPSSCTRWMHEIQRRSRDKLTVSEEEQQQRQKQQEQQQEVQSSVLDCVGRLFYIWETRRIPHTLRELQSFRSEQRENNSGFHKEEEEWNEDNFPHRYLHPAATFSVALSPGLNFFDPDTMRDARSVELDASYTGMRLSAVDVRDARVFDVAMKNSSRNLLTGRPALQRFGKGAANCFLAYQLTLYPERMAVEHHVTDAVISVARIDDVAATAPHAFVATRNSSSKYQTRVEKRRKKHSTSTGEATQQQLRFGTLARSPAPTQHLVTLHGRMTWRLPSMKGGECMSANYTRVMIFTKKSLPAQNREWERLRSPPYVLMNDQLFLYPAPSPLLSTSVGPSAIFKANTPMRLSRLVVEFGLEACRDGVALVRDVMERTTSPASEYAALQALVLGVVGPRAENATIGTGNIANGNASLSASAAVATTAGTLMGEDAATFELARVTAARLTPVLEAYTSTASAYTASSPKKNMPALLHTYVIFSVLEGAAAAAAATKDENTAVWGVEGKQQDATMTSSTSTLKQQQFKRKESNEKGNTEKNAVNKTTVKHEAESQVQQQQQRQSDGIRAWATGVHTVTRQLVHEVTSITNACYTLFVGGL